MGALQTLRVVGAVLATLLVGVSAKPIVDPGLFVIQGVTSCLNGTGYCMLGNDCSIDVDFLPAASGHCKGLRDAFTPKIDFVCCKYNPFGKASSEPPTTTISSYTITDVFSLLDEEVMQQQQQEDYSDINPENVIDIVGVVTDFTGIVGLVTRPWTGTFPTKATSPTTTPMTPSSPASPPTTPAPLSPATPVPAGLTETTEEEAATEATPEPTESYNEIPVGMTEGDEAEVQQETTQQGDSTTPSADLTPAAGTAPATSLAPEVVGASDVSSESDEEDDMNAIIFPDDPILAVRPETEALEAVTETQVADTQEEAVVEGALLQILDISDVGGHQSQASTTTQASTATASPVSSVPTSGPSSGPLEVQQIEVAGGVGEETDVDYDYYANYPDQILLQPVNQNICGFKGAKPYDDQLSSRILGGVVASTVEWCWVAAIMERRQGGNKFVCSGALVESNLVLTTATCLKRLQNRDLSRYIVVFGDSNLREDLPYGVQFHSLAEVVTHPDYFTSGGAHASDIGVIRLRDHATLSDNVCLVCMAQQDAMFPAQTCTVTGYGVGDIPAPMLKDVQQTVPLEGILRQLSVPVHKEADCRDTLRNVTRSEILASSDSFLCAGGTGDGSACYSTMDGGSPLACEAGGRWFLAGLVSWSRDCTEPGTPNVYTRVSSFTNWLQATHLRMMGFATHQVDDTAARSLESKKEGNGGDPTRPEEEEEETRPSGTQEAQEVAHEANEETEQDTKDGSHPPAVPQEPPTSDGLRPEATATADTTASSDSPFDETTSPPSTTDEAGGNEESEQVSEDNETSPAPDDEDEEAQTLGESGDASTTEFYGAFATEELQSVTTGSTQSAADDLDEEMQTERPDEVPRPGNTSVFLESQTTEGSLSTSEADQDTSEYQEAETESEQPPDSLFSTTPEGPSILTATVSPEDPFPEELPAPPDSEALQDTDAPAVTVVADSHGDNATLSPESAFTQPTIYEEPDSTTASSESSTSEDFIQVTTDTSQVTIDYQNDEMEEQPEETTTSNTPEESLGVTVGDSLESQSTEGLLSGTTDPNQITSDYPNDAISTTPADETTLPTMSEESVNISTTTSPENRPTPFDSEPLQATDAPVVALSTDSHSDYDTTQFPDAESTNEPQHSTPLDEGLKIPVTEVPSSLLGQEEKETQHQQEDPSRPYVINSDICGFKGTWNHLVKEPAKEAMGGVAASTVEFCWMAAIMERRGGTLEYLCSGALVEADLVLTAASCLRKLNTSDLYRYIVVLGDSNLREDLPYGVQFHSLAEVVIHPAYSTSEDVHANDIGVLRLTGQATLSHQVCLVCLAQQGAAFPAHSCVLSGYSIAPHAYDAFGGPPSTVPLDGVLRKHPVSLLTKDECQEALYSEDFSEIKTSSDAFLCSRETDAASACYGTLDGGSPLTCEVGGRWFLAGLASWGRGCAVPGGPLVHTRVASFMDWLRGGHGVELTEATVSPKDPPEDQTSLFDTEALQGTESPIINVIIDSPDEGELAHKVPEIQVVRNSTCGFKGDWNELTEESTGGMQGGVAASTVEWCWVAALVERRGGTLEYLCSGALVEVDLVLTTASCLKRLNTRELHRYIVVLGDSNLREDLPYGVQFHALSQVVVHPHYSTFDDVHANDIGIMMLRDHASFGHQVCSVCLALQDVPIPSQDCVLAGYGIPDGQLATAGGHEGNPTEGILRKVSLPLLKEKECREAVDKVTLTKPSAASNSFLCAGSLGKTSACYSTMAVGSPLACGVRGRWFLAGLASWTGNCAVSGGPGVFTRMTAFSNWLRESSVLMRRRKYPKMSNT